MSIAARLAATVLATAAACAAAATPAPQSVTASYELYRNGGHIAVMNEVFEAKDGGYRIVSETRAVGLFALFERIPLRFTSTGRTAAAGLQPEHFEGKRGNADPRRASAEFDWQAGRITIARDGRSDTLALPPGTQDRLSVMYQFMFLALEKLRRLEFPMTNGRKLGQYRYTVQPGVEIDTPLGRMPTLHLVKQHRPDESGSEIWLAPQYRHLPVKILVVEEDGTRYEQVITRLDVTP